jgi:hypothetical protein
MHPALIALLATPILLVLEWWRKSVLARLGAVVASLVLLFFAEPAPGIEFRRVSTLPPDERITTWATGRPMPDYVSGVATGLREADAQIEGGRRDRQIAVGILVWLIVSPLIRSALRTYSAEPKC